MLGNITNLYYARNNTVHLYLRGTILFILVQGTQPSEKFHTSAHARSSIHSAHWPHSVPSEGVCKNACIILVLIFCNWLAARLILFTLTAYHSSSFFYCVLFPCSHYIVSILAFCSFMRFYSDECMSKSFSMSVFNAIFRFCSTKHLFSPLMCTKFISSGVNEACISM